MSRIEKPKAADVTGVHQVLLRGNSADLAEGICLESNPIANQPKVAKVNFGWHI